MKELIFHADPGHGWVEVEKAELIRLGVASEISHYSYRFGSVVYLEEDCDAGIYIEALKEKDGIEDSDLRIIEESYNNECPIRNYPSYY